MFERYTEKARRVIFFARYEASQYGSPCIETEHLLLGLLREERRFAPFFKVGDAEAIRKQIDERSAKRGKISTAVDIPLANESKRVLGYAAEEADQFGHRHIGTEHLLLGLLREENCFAAEILRQHGLELDQLRQRLEEPVGVQPAPRRRPLRNTVQIHGSTWDADWVRDAAAKCREYSWHWQKQAWHPRDIVIHSGDSRVSFDLSLAEDPTNFQLVKNGWKRDHCVICRWELAESGGDEHSTGYTNGRDWVCVECYEKFVSRPDFFSSPYSDVT
jgi:hypothetical protein